MEVLAVESSLCWFVYEQFKGTIAMSQDTSCWEDAELKGLVSYENQKIVFIVFLGIKWGTY